MEFPLPPLRTVFHALAESVERAPNAPLFWQKHHGHYVPTSRAEFERDVKRLSLGLEAVGFKKGECLAILSANRVEWIVANLAAMALGGVAVGMYTSSNDEQMAYILNHCDARFVVVDGAVSLGRVLSQASSLPALQHVIVMDGASTTSDHDLPAVHAYSSVLSRGASLDPQRFDEHVKAVDPEALATLIYTSGTTGAPKGVMLNQRMLCASAIATAELLGVVPGEETLLSYLPLAHIAEQLGTVYGPIFFDGQIYFAESIEKTVDNLREVQPTIFCAVPRLWLKMRAALEAEFARLPPPKRAVLSWARRVTFEARRRMLEGENVPAHFAASARLAERLILRGLHQKLGLCRAHIVTSSAAPIGRDVLDFYASLGLVVRELYGQSEIAGATTANTPGATRFGTVGRPAPGMEAKLADDGEVLARGTALFMGYFKNPEATEAALVDGWLRSGDVAAFDDAGYLRVFGRKKDMIRLESGKIVAPAAIEELLKGIAPIEHALVVGNGRKHLAAVLALDVAAARAFARERGMLEDLEQLVREPTLRAYIAELIDSRVNPQLAPHEVITKFVVVPSVPSITSGELTPTLKLKRNVVEVQWAEAIESLYAEATKTVAAAAE